MDYACVNAWNYTYNNTGRPASGRHAVVRAGMHAPVSSVLGMHASMHATMHACVHLAMHIIIKLIMHVTMCAVRHATMQTAIQADQRATGCAVMQCNYACGERFSMHGMYAATHAAMHAKAC